MASSNVKHWEVIVYHETKLNREMFRAVVSAPDRYTARDTVLTLSPATLSVMQTSTMRWCPFLSLAQFDAPCYLPGFCPLDFGLRHAIPCLCCVSAFCDSI